jgi:predicted transposase/invertase (TIGR01784 family)
MALGIRPINEFAFKKTFGKPENRLALISLLNAILQLEAPIVDVTIENPYYLQNFYVDKLSILDIKAIDQRGRIHNVEMQLTAEIGLVQRIVFYGCELYSGQMKLADNYADLHSVHSICLLSRSVQVFRYNQPQCVTTRFLSTVANAMRLILFYRSSCADLLSPISPAS